MIVPDANLLIYSVDSKSVFHERARMWLQGAITGPEPVGLAWGVLVAFIRVTTRPGVIPEPIRVPEAFDLVAEWLSHPPVRLLEPGPRHFDLLRELLVQAGTGGNLTSDAHLAAIAMEHGAEVYSSDGDFARFAGLRWRNPLQP